jgi:hypothetical protein
MKALEYISPIYCDLFLASSFELPLSKWVFTNTKDVSSIINLINVAPLLPILPENPNLTLDVAMSVRD